MPVRLLKIFGSNSNAMPIIIKVIPIWKANLINSPIPPMTIRNAPSNRNILLVRKKANPNVARIIISNKTPRIMSMTGFNNKATNGNIPFLLFITPQI